MRAIRKVAPVAEDEAIPEDEPVDEEPAEEAVASLPDAEPCQHPNAHGVCWYQQIGDACGTVCRWAMKMEPANR